MVDGFLSCDAKENRHVQKRNEREKATKKDTHTHKQAAQKWQCRLNKLHCEWGMGHAFALTV